MYHDLPRTARFWSFLLAIDQDLAETSPQERMSLRRTSALRQLPPQAARHSRPATRATVPQTELLLRSRRLQEESDTAVGTLPRPKGLPRRHRHPHQRHAAGADATPSPRALRSLRRRPTDHRSLAGLLARTLSPDTVLEDRTRRFGTGCQDRQPAILAGGRLPPPPSPLQGLDASASISLTDHDPRSPANRGLAMIALRPAEDVLRSLFLGRCIEDVTVPSPWFARRCDDSNTPQFDRRLVGAVSVLRGGLALELSPCARSAQDSHPLPCRQDLVTSRDRTRCPFRGRHHRALVLHGAPPARRPGRRLAPRRAQGLRQDLPGGGPRRAAPFSSTATTRTGATNCTTTTSPPW